jgi:hypothetical protein
MRHEGSGRTDITLQVVDDGVKDVKKVAKSGHPQCSADAKSAGCISCEKLYTSRNNLRDLTREVDALHNLRPVCHRDIVVERM